MVVGGLCAGLAAAWDPGLPIFVHLPLAVLAGMIAGGIWGFIPGFLKAQTGAHEVITTIMLNYLAYRISTVVIGQENLPLVNPALQATLPAVDNATLPRLVEGTRLHAGILIALAAAVVVWFLLYRTVFGYKIRTVGLSPGAAAFAGISWGRTIALAMLLSGVLAGLGGTVDALGLQGRYYNITLGHRFHLDRGWAGRAQHPVRRRPGRAALRSAGFRGDEDAEHGWHLAGYRLRPARVRHPVRIGVGGGATVPPGKAAGSQSAWHDTRPGGARRRRSAGGGRRRRARSDGQEAYPGRVALVFFGGTADGDAPLGGAAHLRRDGRAPLRALRDHQYRARRVHADGRVRRRGRHLVLQQSDDRSCRRHRRRGRGRPRLRLLDGYAKSRSDRGRHGDRPARTWADVIPDGAHLGAGRQFTAGRAPADHRSRA